MKTRCSKLSHKTNQFDSGLDPVTSKKKATRNKQAENGNKTRVQKSKILNPKKQQRQSKTTRVSSAGQAAGWASFVGGQ